MDTDLWEAVYRRDCPSRTVVAVLADKWALYVLGALRMNGRPMRFNELRRLLDGITQKMLTQTLRALERDGIISRTVTPSVPVRVDYALTPLGASLATLLTAVKDWAETHFDEVRTARERYDAENPA